MHQVEKLQSYFRMGINKPELEEAYLPTPYTNYILIFNDCSIQANEYSYFTDVMEYLLSANPDINIVQVINGANAELIPNVYHVRELSHNHLYFLVKNATVVVTSEHFCSELCGVYDKPLVRISGNSLEKTARPFFNDEKLHTTFCTEKQPSFAAVEPKKCIDKIPAEDIARAVLKKLGIEDPTPSYKTVYTGSLYRKYMIDYLPDFNLPRNISGTQPINARLDLENNMDNVLTLGSHSNVHTLCINSEIDLAPIAFLKNSLQAIAVELNLDFSVEFIKEIHKLGVEVALYTKDKDNLNDLRLKFIDWIVRFIEIKEKPDLPKSKKLFYKSTKLTFSKDKKFQSLAARNSDTEDNKVIDDQIFWNEAEHFLIYSLD